ncbi:MAG: Type IV-A pilus assembly ATPase PilB [Candidatus Azambacteria bacterium GW2011_GWA2_42_9]|uniref:Type IV-A pilus assembly ATPase PilB n=4 Tax=Candidatus Azamiibacteriota TaxID=1752741 RepID=A0A0G0ZBY4_9BACT|nr:MAG: Type IV-A pilus assembly ATPase PilB [Candidatus Azambacteria bacterium GW2011_GWB1_42_17]KKS46202.1 MAG: Type IV-A pilus assembly ATPase PilB [Candidatus Azambacteria bacterium GW2011_GWA1_42_19]KKS75597.1 MAG: Type IV-A pilus assembly ATPase PilB [Candidatus Azambacteria bacterium GW2011_GWA2_42_9]KKS88795.1 MAG: Type IV-A pilus assembly ATPase PilB [Parcubacteria group bacterium GW2011_GWC1_43_11]
MADKLQIDRERKIPPDVLILISEDAAKHYKMIPVSLSGNTLDVGLVDPEDVRAQEALNFLASRNGLAARVFKISEDDWSKLMKQYAGLGEEVGQALESLRKELAEEKLAMPQAAPKSKGEEAPIIRMMETILKHGVESKASDIHIEPTMNKLRVRFRLDGTLQTVVILPVEIAPAVISRIKILSNLQIDETRRPQDGRFTTVVGEREIDLRVAILPTARGEKATMRILDPTIGLKTLPELGIVGRNLEVIERGIRKPFGMILMTGPTGSGKSTTIYGILQILNTEGVNIVSLEDPVEYYVDGVNQSQIRPELGYTFANGLRQILRQDPNIIVVGEMRDSETAGLATQAALTGHLVLSTLHTNDAIGVIPRLINMGVAPYLIPSALNVALAQRLVKRLCPDCKKEITAPEPIRNNILKSIEEMPEEFRPKIKKEEIKIFKPQGCPKCGNKGTRGRIAVFEVLEMTPSLEEIIISGPTESKILSEAKRQGMVTLLQDGILKVLEGIVGFDELAQVVSVNEQTK